MLDVILGAYLAWLTVRGWMRGLVREALGLVGLFLGTLLAFRLGGVIGDFLSRSFGWPPEASRIAGGIALFVLLGVLLGVAATVLTGVMRLPGLNMLNRIGGSVVALLWALALLVVIVNVARVLPLPESWDEQLDRSVVVETVAGPDAWPQRVFHRLAGDSVLATLHSIQSIFGSGRVVPRDGEVAEFPPPAPDEIRQDRDEPEVVLAELNRRRTGSDVPLLALSDALVAFAERRAADSYLTGRLARDSDCVSEAQAYALLAQCSDVIALASTSLAALDGIFADEETAAVVADGRFDRAGVAVVDGPTGRLVLIVLGG